MTSGEFYTGNTIAHFTYDFSVTIQIRWIFHLAVVHLLEIISQEFCTCHDNAAVVPCAKFCSDHFIRFGQEQNEISITFELWWKNISEMGSRVTSIPGWVCKWFSLITFFGHWASSPCNHPHKPCEHNLYTEIIIFPHKENTRWTDYN